MSSALKLNIELDPSNADIDGVQEMTRRYVAARNEMDAAFIGIAKCIGVAVSFAPDELINADSGDSPE